MATTQEELDLAFTEVGLRLKDRVVGVGISQIVQLTQAEMDLLITNDATDPGTLYVVKG